MKILLAALFSLAAAFGQIVPGRYVVELAGSPAALAVSRHGSRLAVQESDFQTRRATVRQAQAAARRAIANLGGAVLESMDTVVNALIVSIPDSQASALAQLPGVLRVHPVHRVRPLLDHALPIHKVPDAWNSLAAGPNSAGAGVKIGMIDSGIDVHHPGFSLSLPPVSGFPKVLVNSDLQYTNSKVIVAKNYSSLLPDGGDPDADDHDGHGTGTSMAAAGGPAVTPYGSTITGIAPQAYLGSYKVLDAGGTTSDVVAKAIDDAVADGMDVINLSIGGPVESTSDVSPHAIGIAAIEGAAQAGVIVTIAAGNDGPSAGTLGDYANAPDAISAGAMNNDRTLAYQITTPGLDPYQSFVSDGPKPTQPLTAPLFDVAALDSTGLTCSPLPAASVTGKIVLVQRGTCTFESKLNNVAAGGGIAAIVYNSPTGALFETIGVTVGAATLPAMFIDRPAGLDLQSRLAATPGLAVTLGFGQATASPLRTDLVGFSSRGPSIAGVLKPDLVAVGDNLITAAQHSYTSGDSYDGSGFIDTAGTSFSAPLTAGAAAVLKAARPGLTMAQYRSLLINTSTPATASAGAAATVQQAGAGVLNLAAALKSTVAALPTSLDFGIAPGGAISSRIALSLANVGTVPDTYTIAVQPFGSSPIPALAVPLAAGASQQIPVSVNLTGVAPGEYQGYLVVTGAANATPVTIPYWYAVPGNSPAGLALIYVDDQPISAGHNDRKAIVFRVLDLAGLPLSGPVAPTASIASGAGTLNGPYLDPFSDIPNTWAIDVRPASGSSIEVTITLGALTASASFSVN